MGREIVVTGFPKCGTTALMARFEADPEVTVLRTPEGGIEVTWPRIRELAPQFSAVPLGAHKFTAYAYIPDALEWLASSNPARLFVLCVRDPAKALVSWHNMHRAIARAGTQSGHFAVRERDFYSDCSIPDYYRHYAARRLRYQVHFDRLLRIVPVERVAVVSQERMARGIEGIADWIKAVACGQDAAPVPEGPAAGHRSYADRAGETVPEAILQELREVRAELMDAVAGSGVRAAL